MSKAGTFKYFAYGSNLWSKRIHVENKTARIKAVALLKDYELEFTHFTKRWKGAAANIIPKLGANVYGVLWELDCGDQKNLDRQEGVADNIYERFDITVRTLEGNEESCVSYRLTESTRKRNLSENPLQLQPSLKYKNVLVQGAKENGLPMEYIEYLENIPDNGYNGEVDVQLPMN